MTTAYEPAPVGEQLASPTPPPCAVDGCRRLALTGTDQCARHTATPANMPANIPAPPAAAPDDRPTEPRRDRRRSQGTRARIKLDDDTIISVDPDTIRTAPGAPLTADVHAALRRSRLPVVIERPGRPSVTGRILWAPMPPRRRRDTPEADQ